MPRLGDHDYHYFTYNNENFLLTFGDCEYIEARRFLDNLSEHAIDQLKTSIMKNIWEADRFGAKSSQITSYLIGQDSTQEFINAIATDCTFFGICRFNLICLAYISLHPYPRLGDKNIRWNIELEFGSAAEIHINHDPNALK